ncbi:MAG: methyltransferase [Ktedonobacteraceae bacterium]
MLLQSRLLAETIQLTPEAQVLFLNSAADPFVIMAAQHLHTGAITLAEDNIASLHIATQHTASASKLRHIAFHEYTLQQPAATMDTAIMNLLYQPSNTWMLYGLQIALYALKAGGRLYVIGAKDRGILSIAKRMQEHFGNVETLTISKGYRVVSSRQSASSRSWPPQGELLHFSPVVDATRERTPSIDLLSSLVFADGKLDEGTNLLLHALEIQPTDTALDIGCGAGYIGLHIAHSAPQGNVTMVDVSLAAVAIAHRHIAESGLTNIQVLPGDGAEAVLQQRFDLVATNPPFHHSGIQTTRTAERFIREAAQILHPQGRFYLVANRFLKYEAALSAYFKRVDEVGGNTRYKVLKALK